jgi:hypothetical protein
MTTEATPVQRYAVLATWLALALGMILLAARYADLPSQIPVYRSASGHATAVAPKSVAIVFRIVGMGVGQAGATTAMWLHARDADNPGWRKFWAYASLAAAAKTLIECAEYATLAVPLARQYAFLWVAAALLPVLVFLGLAARLWLTRQLSNTRRSAFKPRTAIAVAVALVTWLGLASFPKWLG